MLVQSLVLSSFFLNSVSAWGVVGHEVVATIAQIHLFPSTVEALKLLLPASGGHLAPIAAWADRVRTVPALRWTGQLHYTSPTNDHPPEVCRFGEAGWKTEDDVLNAITNFTRKLIKDPTDGLALRLLVHFVGDVHQPLHLTSRERGGNGDPVIFEGRRTNLHSVWDGLLVGKKVREMRNYTVALPSTQIEDSLRGTIYDPLIRLILWEGVRSWWSISSWLTCPTASPAPPSYFQQLSQYIIGEQNEPRVDRLVCPIEWARETHKITCETAYRNYDIDILQELNTEVYYGPIRDNNLIERLLAQGGLRLAATLNMIYATTIELQEQGTVRRLFDDKGNVL